jgi:hypothetical protein
MKNVRRLRCIRKASMTAGYTIGLRNTVRVKVMKKQQKAWAVISTHPQRKVNFVEPEISDARVISEHGDGHTFALGVYRDEWLAKEACHAYRRLGIKQIVVPCTITYEI